MGLRGLVRKEAIGMLVCLYSAARRSTPRVAVSCSRISSYNKHSARFFFPVQRESLQLSPQPSRTPSECFHDQRSPREADDDTRRAQLPAV